MKSFSQKKLLRNVCKFILTLILFLVIQNYSSAQIQNVRFEHLTINDGLSQGSVRRILRDKIGFMWFGTQDGLNRYDGYTPCCYRQNAWRWTPSLDTSGHYPAFP